MPKGRTIRKLMGVGGGGAKHKKQGKIKWKKNSRTPINPPSPHTFSSGPSLISGRGHLQEVVVYERFQL